MRKSACMREWCGVRCVRVLRLRMRVCVSVCGFCRGVVVVVIAGGFCLELSEGLLGWCDVVCGRKTKKSECLRLSEVYVKYYK